MFSLKSLFVFQGRSIYCLCMFSQSVLLRAAPPHAFHPKSAPATNRPNLFQLLRSLSRHSETSFQRYPVNLPPPQVISSSLLFKDSSCILVNDAYPKSTFHCLIIPQDPSLVSLNHLTDRHIPLLRHMAHVADGYVAWLKGNQPEMQALRFISGFHAIPSLPMLHMHLLSMDLDSDRLKKKNHYNTFATHYFLPSAEVVRDLERNHRVTLNQDVERLEQLEKQPYKCLWCGSDKWGQLLALKEHIKLCPFNRSREVAK